MIETHCHLDYLKEVHLPDLMIKCSEVGVSQILTISVSPKNLDDVVSLTEIYPNVYGTQGIHPHEAKHFSDEVLNKIKASAKTHSKILAIGEIGLDYHYNNSPKEDQLLAFEKQLELADSLNLPVVIHSRDAEEDTIKILEKFRNRVKGVIHSFTSHWSLGEFALDMGLYLGFNGIITFKNAQELRESLQKTPIERILLETDAPFLTPIPFRGKENNSSYLPYILEKIAQIKGTDQNDLEQSLDYNANLVFGFDKTR